MPARDKLGTKSRLQLQFAYSEPEMVFGTTNDFRNKGENARRSKSSKPIFQKICRADDSDYRARTANETAESIINAFSRDPM